MPRKGQTMLYRPVPQDFVDRFIELGWGGTGGDGVEKHYHAHAKTIKRWMVICGYDALRLARAEFVRQNGRRQRRYGE